MQLSMQPGMPACENAHRAALQAGAPRPVAWFHFFDRMEYQTWRNFRESTGHVGRAFDGKPEAQARQSPCWRCVRVQNMGLRGLRSLIPKAGGDVARQRLPVHLLEDLCMGLGAWLASSTCGVRGAVTCDNVRWAKSLLHQPVLYGRLGETMLASQIRACPNV